MSVRRRDPDYRAASPQALGSGRTRFRVSARARSGICGARRRVRLVVLVRLRRHHPAGVARGVGAAAMVIGDVVVYFDPDGLHYVGCVGELGWLRWPAVAHGWTMRTRC